MPNVPNSTITERIGVYYAGYLFSLGGVIFRETSNTDVGIDAQIELIDSNGGATGKLAGIQIKSGDSFVDVATRTFTLRAEQKHFEYWTRYTLPVIGVAYSPSLNKAVWFNLTEYSHQIIEEGGSYRVAGILDEGNELNEQNISNTLTRIIQEFHGMPVSLQEAEQIAHIQELPEEVVEVEETKEAAWKRLTNILLASQSEPDVLANVGSRLSWYFSTVSQEQKDFFVERISNATNEELTNIIIAIDAALSRGRDDTAQLICDLLSYIPHAEERLKDLARQRVVPVEALEALFQSIENFTEDFEAEFRKEIIDLYGITETDIP